ncbi:hypothetical protein COO00_18930 [Bacillus toyonensis]|nr:hypothetical protein CON93_07045 [Bacillus toyonensis]PEA71062.1 hypothetical protein COO00_18930 [Bacillus toyonensis]
MIRIRIKLDRLNTIDFEAILEEAKKEASSKGYSSSPSAASQKNKESDSISLNGFITKQEVNSSCFVIY